MNAAAIRLLVETRPAAQLQAAGQALEAGRAPGIAVPGDSAGEQLTHVLAALFILDYMKKNEAGFTAASREFFRKVRESIS